jgi:hypothetical protein
MIGLTLSKWTLVFDERCSPEVSNRVEIQTIATESKAHTCALCAALLPAPTNRGVMNHAERGQYLLGSHDGNGPGQGLLLSVGPEVEGSLTLVDLPGPESLKSPQCSMRRIRAACGKVKPTPPRQGLTLIAKLFSHSTDSGLRVHFHPSASLRTLLERTTCCLTKSESSPKSFRKKKGQRRRSTFSRYQAGWKQGSWSLSQNSRLRLSF